MRIVGNALHGCQFDSWWYWVIQVLLQSGFYANPISVLCSDLKVVQKKIGSLLNKLDVLSSGLYALLIP